MEGSRVGERGGKKEGDVKMTGFKHEKGDKACTNAQNGNPDSTGKKQKSPP